MPGLVIENGVTIGNNLQSRGTLLLGQAAPVGGVQVTISSNSPDLLLATSATAAGFQVRTATVNMAPSGVTITGPFGAGFPLQMTLAGGARPATLSLGLLDPSTNAFVVSQPLSGGLSLTVTLNNSNPNAATLATQVTIAGGVSDVDVPVQPVAVGSTLISMPLPAGYTLPRTSTSLSVTVSAN